MPNWIYNDVTVSGDKDQMNKFFEDCFDKGGCIDFDKIVPSPKTKKDCPKDYICNPEERHIEALKGREWFDWYNWNCNNWGTKWNACDGYCDDNGHFFFATPWCSPAPIFRKLMELYPKLCFEVDVDGEIDEPYSITYHGKGTDA